MTARAFTSAGRFSPLGARGISVPVNQSTNQSQQGLMLGGNRPAIKIGSNFDVSDRAARWKIRLMYDVCVHRLVVAAEIPSITIRTSGKLSEMARHSQRSPCFELRTLRTITES